MEALVFRTDSDFLQPASLRVTIRVRQPWGAFFALSTAKRFLDFRIRPGAVGLRGRCASLLAASVFTFYYVKYSRMIDARLSGHVLQNTTQIFSAPERISDGQAWGVA